MVELVFGVAFFWLVPKFLWGEDAPDGDIDVLLYVVLLPIVLPIVLVFFGLAQILEGNVLF
jgi:hypothetical protein